MEIRGLIGKVSKLDFNTDSKARGRYARMAVFVNLGRPLVSKILIKGNPQIIEYENLPIVSFKYGFYGHSKESCLSVVPPPKVIENEEASLNVTAAHALAGDSDYGPWMLVERRSRRGVTGGAKKGNSSKKGEILRSRFQSLADLEAVLSEEGNPKITQSDSQKKRKAPIITTNNDPLTGRKDIKRDSKKPHLALSVDKIGMSQTRAPRNIIFNDDRAARVVNVDLEPSAVLKATNPPSLGLKDQTHNTICVGSQQEPPGSAGPITECSKISNALNCLSPNLNGSTGHLIPGNSNLAFPLVVNSQNNLAAGQKQLESNQCQYTKSDHVVHYNPAFEENSFVNVEIKDGVLEAKNHSAIVFNNSRHLEHTVEKSENSPLAGANSSKLGFKRLNANGTNNKGGCKLNKTLKGPGNRFKNLENSRISFAVSMNKTAELIVSEMEGNSANESDRHLERNGKLPHLDRQISGNRADSIIAKMGWDKSHRVKTVGFSGGIWIGWNNSIDLKIVGNHLQFILASICSNLSSSPLLIAFVYGSPDKLKRKTLRNDLSHSLPWLVIGDFNTIVSSTDKKGGNIKGRRCQFFGEFMEKAQLHDLGFQGSPFTWHRGNLSECLDRAVGDSSLRKKESSIRDELENTLFHGEILWKQKSRCEWLKLGDHNTSYFHRRTVQRRNFNKITALRNEDGEWIYDSEALKAEAVNFFQNLYGENYSPCENIPPSVFPSLGTEDAGFFRRNVTNEEIKAALFDMAP
ncbi:hypothetical protein J1N35_033911 [Gossypium stocksii]|uniref:Endonuclease/exonuclease/phosphatase domain-containing protein n=1 Tax=Gossypium stocksii TaxID=47602 RepID=A0A9D3UQZ8_9ROSI|nr:hypothetical protein J1N35_033911 [Gossypium stocksii]